MTNDEPRPQLPQRRIDNADALRALAHPLRLRILELLVIGGPSTATELAPKIGQSPSACSWHLRHLAAHEFLEQAPGGKGRERHWRVTAAKSVFGHSDEQPDVAEASHFAGSILLEREVAELREWRAHRSNETAEWHEAAFISQSLQWMTAEELEELRNVVDNHLRRYATRLEDPDERPNGSRPVRTFMWGIPARPLENDSASSKS